jgi:hypothetical protein
MHSINVRLIDKMNLSYASLLLTFFFPLGHIFSFRDRRYEYKGLNKVWKGKLSEAKASGNSIKIQEAQVQLLCLSLLDDWNVVNMR